MALIWKCMSSVAFGYNDKQHLQCWITTSNPKNGRGMENEVGTPSRLRRYFQWLTFQQLVLVWHVFSYKWCSGPGLIWSSDRACHCPQWGPRGAGHHRSCTTKNCTSRPFCRPLWARSRRPSLVAGFGVQACMMSIQMSACACGRVIVGVSLKHTSYFETHWGFIDVYCAFWTPTGFWKTVGPVGETKCLWALCFWWQWIRQFFPLFPRTILNQCCALSCQSNLNQKQWVFMLTGSAVSFRDDNVQRSTRTFSSVKYINDVHESFAWRHDLVSCTKLERFDQWGFHLRYLTQHVVAACVKIIWCAMMPLCLWDICRLMDLEPWDAIFLQLFNSTKMTKWYHLDGWELDGDRTGDCIQSIPFCRKFRSRARSPGVICAGIASWVGYPVLSSTAAEHKIIGFWKSKIKLWFFLKKSLKFHCSDCASWVY